MSKEEMILALGNALILLESVETHGEKNLNAMLGGMSHARKVYRALKETKGEMTDEKRNND